MTVKSIKLLANTRTRARKEENKWQYSRFITHQISPTAHPHTNFKLLFRTMPYNSKKTSHVSQKKSHVSEKKSHISKNISDISEKISHVLEKTSDISEKKNTFPGRSPTFRSVIPHRVLLQWALFLHSQEKPPFLTAFSLQRQRNQQTF